MPDQLPKGWVKTTLGEISTRVATIQPEATPDTEFTYFDIGGIDNQTNRIVETKTVAGREAPSRARQSVRKDDILFSTVRTYLKKIARIERDYPNPVASTGFTVIRAAEGVSPQLLFSQVMSEDFLQPLHALQTGSSYPAVRDKDVFAQPIRLAPTREQERIVAKLDALLSRLAAGEAAARRALERLKRYRAAVLHAAVTGELTREWRKNHKPNETGAQLLGRLLQERRACWEESELKRLQAAGKPPKDATWKRRYPDPVPANRVSSVDLPEPWTWVSPEQLSAGTKYALAIGPFGSNLKVSDYRESGVPLIFVRNIMSERFLGIGSKCVSHDKAAELFAHQAIGGDLLITKMGNPPGDACIYPEEAPSAIITADCIRLHLARSLEQAKQFFVYCINSRLGREQFRQITSGVAQQKVSLARFTGIALPLPPLPEQTAIVSEVEQRLAAADRLAATLNRQLDRSWVTRQSLLREAFAGLLVPQNPSDEPASSLLERIRTRTTEAETRTAKTDSPVCDPGLKNETADMNQPLPSAKDLHKAWKTIGKKPDAKMLFDAAGFEPDQVVSFYGLLRTAREIVEVFQAGSKVGKPGSNASAGQRKLPQKEQGRFRLVRLWLQDFKNLKDYEVHFNSQHGQDIVLGWNGTGKSNLFESLVIIFRDLHYWREKNNWTHEPMGAYRIEYEIEGQIVKVDWNPQTLKRPEVQQAPFPTGAKGETFRPVKREDMLLPKFVFGYYSGPTNRLAEHFLPMKRDHYDRLRTASSDAPETLACLLEQRRFFCAETHHAKYVLLAFSYKEDPKIRSFLEERLRIVGFESALFVIRKPRWAKGKPEDFWGATGIMRRVMEKLRRYAIAPMVLKQKVSDGYRLPSEELYYFFLPDQKSLHEFAAEYADARSFFLALESTDFSELIHDVKIQVRVKSTGNLDIPITFRELSEGEQQLLVVLGLMRFTKSHQSLLLLDEPDTHLNPHWSVQYLKDLVSVVSDGDDPSPEQQTSQLLMATHDPLVIASLLKEQVHLLKRDPETLECRCEQASVNPKGLGFTGILTSEMFGFRSDLDPETLEDLDNRVRLIAKERDLSGPEKTELEAIDKRLAEAGFSKAFSDPYYAAFVRAWGRKYTEQMAGREVLTKKDTEEVDRIASEVLAEAVAEVEKEADAHAIH